MTVYRRCKLPISRPLFLFLSGLLFGLLTFNTVIWLKHRVLLACREPHYGRKTFTDRYERDARRPFNVAASARTSTNGGLVLLGVMTAEKYVDTRAYNVWRTWAHSIPGRAFFFVAANTTSAYEAEMPIIRLPGVDDVYPPQKKSFVMLRWMYDNYLEDFNWFMRADDDLYVRNDRLAGFLRSLDANKAHMLGQAGLGKSAEYGQLALGARDNYCMGGPGVILSRAALRQLGPHLEECLHELATSHEDVEIGRCVRRYVGITCTWNYEMQTLFHNNQTSDWAADAVVTSELRRVITLHPVKNPDLMLKVHIHAQTLRLAELRARRVALTREMRALSPSTDALNAASTMTSAGLQASLKLTRRLSKSSADLTRWEYISLNRLLFCDDRVNCPRHTINANMRAVINHVVVQLFDKFNANARQRGRLLQFRNIQYGYVRVEPRYGVDYVLDIVLWFNKLRPSRMISVRRHAYVQQTFGALEALTDAEYRALRQIPSEVSARADSICQVSAAMGNTGDGGESVPPLYIVMALQGRAETFQRFARNLREILIPERERSIKIIIVLYRCNNVTENVLISETIGELSSFLHIRVVDMATSADTTTSFSRGQALKIGASSAPNDALLFFTDVDMLFNYATLQRIRLNTIEGVQVYFPIIFSEYMPKYWLHTNANEYAADRGYFRSFGFGIVSIYARDFVTVGGFNLTIRGWGMEDVDFFERCLRSRLRVLRVPDPSLIHVAHSIECRHDTMPDAQYRMCVGTKAASLASQEYLAHQLAPHFQV